MTPRWTGAAMAAPDDRRVLDAILRQDLSAFAAKSFATLEPGREYVHNWHLDHMAWQLGRVARGEIRRLIINVPPRSMKSIMVSVAFTAWVMGHDPAKRVMCISYADEFARKLAGDTLTVMKSPWYQRLFPGFALASGRPALTDIRTTAQGFRFAAGMNGSVLGRGADLLVIDDPIKASDAVSAAERRRVAETFDNTLYTRLNDKRTGAIVIVMQRLHEDDLVGHVLGRGGAWEVASIPAIAPVDASYRLGERPGAVLHRRAGDLLDPVREPREVLEELRRAQGSLTFSAQYLQAPVPLEGNIVKREWMRPYTVEPAEFDLVIASWDTASTLGETSDWSVGTVWGAKGLDFYLLDRVRGRFEAPDLRREIIALARRWRVNQTLVEDTELGRAVCQDLRRAKEISAVLCRPKIDKEARIVAQSARFEAGQVFVPAEKTWYAEWLHELLAFPNGRHDDQVDSTSQALHYLSGRQMRAYSVGERRERPERAQARPRPRGPISRNERIGPRRPS